MSGSDFSQDMGELVSTIFAKVFASVQKHWMRVVFISLVLVTVVFASSEIINWYAQLYAKEIVLLTGRPGSDSYHQAELYADAISSASPAPGLKYTVRQQQTAGYDEIQRLVASDKTGTFVGFGFEAADKTYPLPQVLLPLDWEFLHVLCSRTFVSNNFEKQPTLLTEVLPKMKSGRMFLGPKGSGTRRIAESVLDLCTPTCG